MRTRLWAGPATPAANGTGCEERSKRARKAGRIAYQPALALAAVAAALVLVVLTSAITGARSTGEGRWAHLLTLAAAAAAAGLAFMSAVAARRHVVRPLGRLEQLAGDVVTGQSGLVALARAGVRAGEDMAPLMDAVEMLAAEVGRSHRAQQAVRLSPDLTIVVDADGTILHASPAADVMLGRPAAWLTGVRLDALVHPDDRARLDGLRQHRGERGVRSYEEVRLSHIHGAWIVTEVTALDQGDDPAEAGWVVNVRDVSDRKAHEESLLRRALYDPLTGLANRALFSEHVDRALTALRRTPSRPHAVLFVDLDGFKMVNDTLGHAAGDEVLAEVGRRLQGWMRPGDTAARLGGDEFTVLVEYTSKQDASVLAKRILEVLLVPMSVCSKEVVLSCSIGIAMGEAGQDSEALLRDADVAMYAAKAAGKAQYRMFEPDMHHVAMRRLDLEADLRRAIGRNELFLTYQPIVDLATRRIDAVEVLVRWKHPKRGFIPPLDFISVAEDSGYIRELGRWILGQACHQVREWHRKHPDEQPLRICVNTSVRQIEQEDYFDEVALILADSGLDGRYLTLEITEGLFMSDLSATVEKLRRLKELGVMLAVDDFGTGYSSLSYLSSLPIDILKIDKSFVDGVTFGREQSAVASAVVNLARTFNLSTVAEGIEEPEQAAELLAMGADMGQGYWFSRPLNAEAMGTFLEADRASTPVSVAPAAGS